MNNEWDVIGRGLAGWHAAQAGSSSSGGELLPYTYWTGVECKGYLAEAKEGALVYDASEADESAFGRHVICGPMVDPKLAPNDVKRWSKDISHPLGAHDYVGVGVFEGLLRAIPGMKVGHVSNGTIVWS